MTQTPPITFRASDVFRQESCRRCGGSGRFSFNQMHGDMCYGCQRSGKQWTRKDAPLAADFLHTRRDYMLSTFRHVQVGDVICHPDDVQHPFLKDSRPKPGARFRRVANVVRIEGTPEVNSGRCGSTMSGSDETVWTYYGWVEVTVEGGEVMKHGDCGFMYRRFYLDRILALCQRPETVERVRDFLTVETAKLEYARLVEQAQAAPAPDSAPAPVADLTVRMALKKLPLGELRPTVESAMRQLKRTARLASVWASLPDFARASIATAAGSL